jgi:hypothetical protein
MMKSLNSLFAMVLVSACFQPSGVQQAGPVNSGNPQGANAVTGASTSSTQQSPTLQTQVAQPATTNTGAANQLSQPSDVNGSNQSAPNPNLATNQTVSNQGGQNPQDSQDPNVVVFHIRAGTGNGAWNESSNPIQVHVGQELHIVNDDSQQHWIHTEGITPFIHPFSGIQPGSTGVYKIALPLPNGHLHDHLTQGPVYMNATSN